ncbi:hypothetical protein MNBD_IGNAVI01-2092 [hydrothermal vent metagenome]|uniref:HMA domain-containing protein n=1 Tax=hydrothermal vent metagenome TaxID=652676 RepID=A0A3B1C6X4_9ZZZZ
MEQKNSSNKKWMGAGLVAAFAASLCCITPVLAVLGGLGGIASTFSFLEPLRPYLIGITVIVLGYAFYNAYRPKNEEDIECACEPGEETSEKRNFLNSKAFLWIVTGLSIIMFTFPSYSYIFFSGNDSKKVVIENKGNNIEKAKLDIEGMTCVSCENSVDYALKTEAGVLSAKSSYEKGTAYVEYDKTKTNPDQLKKAVEEKVGYKVKDVQTINK